jgi:outer membrane protein assembly factor BamE
MRKTLIAIISINLAILGLAGCSWCKPYKVDIQQGNVIDQKDTKQLKTGMNKNEVQDLLGTPVLSNGFESNHWTYAYTNQINGGKIEKKVIELYFNHDKVVKIDDKIS